MIFFLPIRESDFHNVRENIHFKDNLVLYCIYSDVDADALSFSCSLIMSLLLRETVVVLLFE
ncbi:hypothetical protein V9J15_01370 [Candidatus Liberibacter africanus]|nr:hypothetical protein [Candidatus Liberibacter africanus]